MGAQRLDTVEPSVVEESDPYAHAETIWVSGEMGILRHCNVRR